MLKAPPPTVAYVPVSATFPRPPRIGLEGGGGLVFFSAADRRVVCCRFVGLAAAHGRGFAGGAVKRAAADGRPIVAGGVVVTATDRRTEAFGFVEFAAADRREFAAGGVEVAAGDRRPDAGRCVAEARQDSSVARVFLVFAQDEVVGPALFLGASSYPITRLPSPLVVAGFAFAVDDLHVAAGELNRGLCVDPSGDVVHARQVGAGRARRAL